MSFCGESLLFILFLKFRLFLIALQLFIGFTILILHHNDDNIMITEVAYMSDALKINETARLVGIRIKHKRKEKNLTQEALSELMGISTGQLSCIERGVYLPTTQNIYKICDILGEEPNYYLVGHITPEYEYKIIQLIKILPKSYQTAIEKSIELLIEAYVEETKDLTNK